MRSLRVILQGLGDLVWPPRCLACDLASTEPFCPGCRDTLLAVPSACEQRLSFPSAPAWTSARAAYELGGQLQVAIRRMKYGGRSAPAHRLGALLLPLGHFDLALAVPLHRRRLRQRGFNQSVELLRGAGVPPAHGLLVRIADTPSQTDLPPKERQRNVAGAFRAPNPERIRGRHLLLVDDVMTTGATADACARVLVEAGAQAVSFVALARAGAAE